MREEAALGSMPYLLMQVARDAATSDSWDDAEAAYLEAIKLADEIGQASDLAVSHVAAAKTLEAGTSLAPVYNLGSGDGLSVRQIMDAMARVTGIDFEPEVHPRRPGDPARIVASGELAARDLDWRMRHTIDAMVASAWSAAQAASA